MSFKHNKITNDMEWIMGLPKDAHHEYKYRIFEEADGWHFCDDALAHLDARGKAYPTEAAAIEAAEQRKAEGRRF